MHNPLKSAPYRPDLVVLAAVPVALFGVAWPLVGAMIALMVGMLAVTMLVALLRLTPPIRYGMRWGIHHFVIAAFAAVVVVSALYPPLIASDTRLVDLVTLLAGLAVLGVCSTIRLSAKGLGMVAGAGGAIAGSLALWQADYVNGRLFGSELNCNYLAAMLALTVVAAVGVAWTGRPEGRWRLLWSVGWTLCAVPGVVAVLATQSRGGMIALGCGLMYLVLAGRRWWWQLAGLALAAGAGLALGVALFLTAAPAPATAQAVSEAVTVGLVTDNASPAPAPVLPGNRSVAELEYNNTVRMRAAMLAVRVSAQHPWLGIGYNGFADYAAVASDLATRINTHNDYLRLSAESGFAALLLFTALLALALCRKDSRLPVPRAIVVCYAVTLLFANTLSNITVSIIFWAALGCLLTDRPRLARGKHVKHVV